MDIKLSNRLEAVYNFIPVGVKVADVGTDHGYIPVRLALEGRAAGITASDLRRGPLERARSSAGRYGVADRICFVLADGLSGIGSDDTDCVLIAGMGGETIAAILKIAPWTKDAGKILILQPQSKGPELCLWLAESGYRILDAALAEDEGKYYTVYKVAGGREKYSDRASLYIHPALIANRDPLLPKYIDRLVLKLESAVRGLEKAEAADRSAEAADLRGLVSGLRKMREETDRWQA